MIGPCFMYYPIRSDLFQCQRKTVLTETAIARIVEQLLFSWFSFGCNVKQNEAWNASRVCIQTQPTEGVNSAGTLGVKRIEMKPSQ